MDNVILELGGEHDQHHHPTTSTTRSVIEASTLTREGWAALIVDIGDRYLDISAPRKVLTMNSTYYRALFGEFREAGLGRISVNWDTSIFLNLLQFMCTGYYNISPAAIDKFLEAATFFGVDAAISRVDEWARSATLSRDPQSIKDILQYLPSIWNTSNMSGYHSLSKFCPEFLAVNFVTVMDLSSFLDLPCSLLRACIEHPQLTVHSERQLCDALLRWLENQDQGSGSGELNTDQATTILSEVQRALLPRSFLLGRLKEDNHIGVSNSIIRITDYLECLDLSGCYEVTDLILFTSAARAPLRLPEHPEGIGTAPPLDPSWSEWNVGWTSAPTLLSSFYNTPARSAKWPRIRSFQNLKRLNLTQCWRIPQDSLVLWLREACPSLLELILINCPQITFSILQALPAVCPQLQLVDISLDITQVCKEVQMYSTEENSSWVRGDASGLWRCSFAGLTQLSLRGHTEISDLELIALAVCSPPLQEIDLSMCTTLTDGGIWRFLKQYRSRLKSFKAKGTAFGSMSCTALTSPSERDSTKDRANGLSASTSQAERLSLVTLDIENCIGVKEEDLANVLRSQSALTHLDLGETNLTDAALSCFSGTLLQQLNVRETRVSGKALASVIRSNPELKILDIRGCKRACIDEYDLLVTERDNDTTTSLGGALSVPLVFQELGRLETRVEDLKVGWRFSDSAQRALQPALLDLKNLSVGMGGTITDAALQNISEHSTSLEQLTLAFQVITEDGLIRFLDKANCLHTLELQYCLSQLSSRGIDSLSSRCSSSLHTLKLERAAPWILDSDISLLSERCTRLSHLSLVGCRALTEESLKIIAKNWRGLTELKLEECNRITSEGADLLLQSCGALEMLTLRHNGKGIAKDFIMDAMIQFPLLRHLSLDMCDSVANGFQTPNQVKGVLNTLLIARCKAHHTSLFGPTAALDGYLPSTVQYHKDTIVTQWNVDEAKLYIVKCRL
ncbi:unnamed protein product [Calypogeia fissa]